MAADDLERARRWGAASGIGVALRAAALVEGGEAPWIACARRSKRSRARRPGSSRRARSPTWGAALRRANRASEARARSRQGSISPSAAARRALAERARTELRAAGPVERPGRRGVEQLTASERRVAELAAEGHSNPEIAQALFVTRKTVETHLGHVYRKLGISGRTKLASALADAASAADA